MTDKMLRVAGRRGDGLAKPITVTQDGALRTTIPQPTTYFGNYKLEKESETAILGLQQDFALQIAASTTYTDNSTMVESGSGYRISANYAQLTFSITNNVLSSVDQNGNILWQKNANELYAGFANIRGVLADGDSVYVGVSSATQQNGRLVKLDLEGKSLWNIALPNPEQLTSLRTIKEFGNKVYAISRNNILHVVLKSDGVIETSKVLFGGASSIAFDNGGNLYISALSIENSIVKYTPTLTVSWTYSLPDSFYISNMIVKNNFLFVHRSGEVLKINTSTGLLSSSFVDAEFKSIPPGTVTEDHFYSFSDQKLIKFDVQDMRVEYKMDISDKKIAAIIERGNTLFIIGQDGALQRTTSDLQQKAVSALTTVGAPVDGITKALTGGKVKIYETYKGYKVIAMLHENYFVQKNNVYYFLNGGWDATPIQIDLPTGTLKWINFVEDRYSWWDTRYRLVANIGEKIYHNYADSSQSDPKIWAESDVWGLPNTLHPTDTTTKLYNNKARPRYYIPQTATDVFNYMGGMQHFRIASDINPDYHFQDSLWFATYSQTATPATVFMTKNGKDIYAEYMYGINPQPSRIGKDIDLSAISGTIPSDLSLRKITAVIPNATNKEPVEVFDFSPEVSVTSMAYTSNKTVVTAPSHGLETGDIIYFKSATSQNNNNWLKPTSYANLLNNVVYKLWMGSTNLPLGNGKVYQVVKLTNDTFNLHEAVGNPHNHLHCTHIHSLDVVPNGIVISTGEAGVLSNITFLGTPSTLSYLPANQQRIFADYAQLHLTANPVQDITGSVQRPLGFYMEEDFYLFASDEQTYRRPVNLPEGRTGAFNFKSSGIYKGKLSEIDDWSKAKVVLQPQTVAFLFKKIGDVFITSDVSGDTYFSVDKGDSWNKLYTFPYTVTKYGGASADATEFVINGYYFKVH